MGAGYAYAGTYGQMVYTTPSFSGVTVDAGLMNPVSPYNQAATELASTGPAVQARATYAGQGFKVWAAHKSQDFTTYRMIASELGGSLNLGAFGLVANYQTGNGLGVLADGDQGNIKNTNTFLQATYKATSKLKLGVGVGQGKNDKAPTGLTLKSNQNTTLAAYYSLTPSFTAVGEIGNTTSKGFDGKEAKQNSLSAGGIFFF